jgi:hypothetical protein
MVLPCTHGGAAIAAQVEADSNIIDAPETARTNRMALRQQQQDSAAMALLAHDQPAAAAIGGDTNMEKQGSEDEQGDNVTHSPARVQKSAGNKAQYNGIEALTNAFEDISLTASSPQRGQNLKKARVWNDSSSDDESDIDGHPKQLGATANTLFTPDTPSAPTPPIADGGIIVMALKVPWKCIIMIKASCPHRTNWGSS